MNFYLICYDIADNKRRLKASRLLEAVGSRVQESVFEAHLPEKRLEGLVKKLGWTIAPAEDTIRVYRLCRGCRESVAVLGVGRVSPEPGLVIV